MQNNILIHDATIVNENKIFTGSILISNGRIVEIFEGPVSSDILNANKTINATGLHLFPGVIDGHVHFREPGLTHKADLHSESKAAITGGVTSFMEMPNTVPQTTSPQAVEEKLKLASDKSLANYAFYIGATNDNLNSILATDPKLICGIKLFLGSSTGNMSVSRQETVIELFKQHKHLLAVHCEDESMIQKNLAAFKASYGDDIPMKYHAEIRSAEACFASTSFAVSLARKNETRLHVLHLSTGKELTLFEKVPANAGKMITAETCVNYLWFRDTDYETLGSAIKMNPAVKSEDDRKALLNGVSNNSIDLISTDHAPHTSEEKNKPYLQCPSGTPAIQHSLCSMLELHHRNEITLEKIIEKICHAPAEIYKIKNRGYIRKGYWADLVLVNLNDPWTVTQDNILYKCGWSPLTGQAFSSRIMQTFVNGNLVYDKGSFNEQHSGMQLECNSF